PSTAVYHRVRRLLKRWEKEGLVTLSKVDGLVVAKPTPLLLHSSSTRHTTRHKSRHTSKLWKPLSQQELDELYSDFMTYLEEVKRKKLVLVGDDLLILPYKTRFTPHHLRSLLKEFDSSFERSGIFLTLTYRGSPLSSLSSLSVSFNRLKAWLRRRLGFTPHHVVTYEFTKRGVLHLHVALFNVSWIMDKRSLTRHLVRMGFGKVNWISRFRDDHVRLYMRKALLRSLRTLEGKAQDKTIALYWATGKRFFSTSRRHSSSSTTRPPRYHFVGVFNVMEVYEILTSLGVYLNEPLDDRVKRIPIAHFKPP
ncbi:MAG: hypothetical protein QXV17_04705, partial [Candidatus Micrarchaeaceae archaeon]